MFQTCQMACVCSTAISIFLAPLGVPKKKSKNNKWQFAWITPPLLLLGTLRDPRTWAKTRVVHGWDQRGEPRASRLDLHT